MKLCVKLPGFALKVTTIRCHPQLMAEKFLHHPSHHLHKSDNPSSRRSSIRLTTIRRLVASLTRLDLAPARDCDWDCLRRSF